MGTQLAYVVGADFALTGDWRFMFALGIVPAAAGLKFVHQHKAKTYQVMARIRGTSDIRSKRHFPARRVRPR
jgi:hypothetical protein